MKRMLPTAKNPNPKLLFAPEHNKSHCLSAFSGTTCAIPESSLRSKLGAGVVVSTKFPWSPKGTFKSVHVSVNAPIHPGFVLAWSLAQ